MRKPPAPRVSLPEHEVDALDLRAQLAHAVTLLQLQQELIDSLQQDVVRLRLERDDALRVRSELQALASKIDRLGLAFVA